LFQMAVIFNEKGVKDCRPPCVAQSFINHNAILYKIYLVGEEYSVVERPSLKNFYPSGMNFIYLINFLNRKFF
jgi:inositol-1,3,4-trisphosphate 5/6-kinase/inositol-tetrakisphosphate 1-kinase